MVKFSVRLEDDVNNELEELCEVLGFSKNMIINNLIRGEYNKIQEDPKIRQLIDIVLRYKKTLESFNSEMDALKQ